MKKIETFTNKVMQQFVAQFGCTTDATPMNMQEARDWLLYQPSTDKVIQPDEYVAYDSCPITVHALYDTSGQNGRPDGILFKENKTYSVMSPSIWGCIIVNSLELSIIREFRKGKV